MLGLAETCEVLTCSSSIRLPGAFSHPAVHPFPIHLSVHSFIPLPEYSPIIHLFRTFAQCLLCTRYSYTYTLGYNYEYNRLEAFILVSEVDGFSIWLVLFF